jgi:hypothetical protein
VAVKIEPTFGPQIPAEKYDDSKYLAADADVRAAVADLVEAGASSDDVAHAVQAGIDDAET